MFKTKTMLKFNIRFLSSFILANVFIASTLFFQACNENAQDENNKINEDQDKEMVDRESMEEDDEKMKGIHGLPSPIQIASTIKKSGINYDASVLNKVGNASNYTNNYKKSLNVGVYGADLGYAAIYDQTQDAITYLNTVKSLADDLGIIGAFERNTLDEVQENLGNQDKLLDIVTNAFFESDQYLQQHKRSKASALILAGGWVEGLYIATQMIKKENNKDIVTRIGEQKITLGILMTLLGQFSDDDEINNLTNSLKDLKSTFDKVEISYEYNPNGNVKDDEANHTTEVLTKSTVTVTDEQLKEISTKIEAIRNSIVS